jgi:hypothetical protein
MNGTGVVNHIWFTLGGEVAEHAVLAFYIDNEPVPSIEFSPTVGLAGAAPEDKTTPWGTEVNAPIDLAPNSYPPHSSLCWGLRKEF